MRSLRRDVNVDAVVMRDVNVDAFVTPKRER